jgi:MOSC domain-containing protein YiiM
VAVTEAEVDLPDPSSGDAVSGRVIAVNVGIPRVVDWFGRRVTTAIWKDPVSGRVPVSGVNVDGDEQADRRVHGGRDMAVYAYMAEDYEWWSEKLGVPLGPGTFGENLTLEGVDLQACAVGETWAVGTAQLRVTQPRIPCFKLGIRMGDAGFVERFAAARRFGTYFAIESPGTIGAGDGARRLARPDPVLTIAEFITAYEDADISILRRLADHALVPDAWRQYARRALQRQTAKPSA